MVTDALSRDGPGSSAGLPAPGGWYGELSRTLRNQRRHLLGLLLPWLLLGLIGVPWLWSETEKAMHKATLRARAAVTEEVRQVVVRTLDLLRHDASFLAEMPEALMLEDVGPESAAARLFAGFARSNRNYDKVRWIDENGVERLRVDQRDGLVTLMPADALQDKRARPFVYETVNLPKGSVYFSEIDLNVEHGGLEQPWRPTLRAVSPVIDRSGRRGVIVINYRVAALLDRLRDIAAAQRFDVYLVNDHGYWIRGPSPEGDWAWQLDRPEATIARTHPGLWEALQASVEGSWRDRGGEWAFFDPAPSQRVGHPDEGEVAIQRLGLRMIVHVPRSTVQEPGWRLRLAVGAVAAVLMLGGTVFVWRMARSMEAEERRSVELERVNRALRDAGRNLDAMQTELARVARLSSLGLMVAGVAHEMNSPLGSVTLALSSAQHHLQDLTRRAVSGLRRSDLERLVADSLAAVQHATDQTRRASEIVQRFKQVAIDRTTLERRSFDLAEAIADADPLLAARAVETPITVRQDLTPGIAMVGYPGPLAQVVSNLVTNAATHAFEAGDSGLISVSARTAGADEVVVIVRDNGRGIAPATLTRVFEPFFTTGRGRGSTGLGLHIVHQIVTDVLGGSIAIDSMPREDRGGARHGTTVTVRLPRVAPESTTVARERDEPAVPQGTRQDLA